MVSSSDWVIWQLIDSAFPAGGFAHSSGLEAARQLGEVDDRDALEAFLRNGLLQAARGMVPFAVAAAEIGAMDSTRARISDLDHRYDVFLSNQIANRASRVQGLGFAAAISRAIGGEAIVSLSRHFSENRLPAHWPVAFGAACGSLGVRGEQLAQMLLFITLRGMVSAAVRLGIVGPMQAQSLQYDLHAFGASLAKQAVLWSIDDVAQTSPGIELIQGMHDRLYSRLFLS